MSKPPLLPSDHFLMQVLSEHGVSITEDEWREFKAEVKRRAAEGPQPAVVAGIDAAALAIISLVFTVISIGLTIVASFFKPRGGNRPAQLEARQGDSDSISNVRRYAPRYGFDALQDPATIGTVIPLVYALREQAGGTTVGGIRVNMPLLWSQLQSLGGSQLLRAIFLISEGKVAELDRQNFAIGNNSISSYDLASDIANSLGSRLTVYFRGDGGRLRSSDRLIGRSASTDTGNSENRGGPDVFALRYSGRWTQDFCSSQKPSTQTTFGISMLIGSNLGYRVNPSIRPTVNAQLVPEGDEGDGKVACPTDDVAMAAKMKYSVIFSTRSGLISGSVGSIGSQVTYVLDSSSDLLTEFSYPASITKLDWSIEVTVRQNPFSGTAIYNPDFNSQLPPEFSVSNSALADLVRLTNTATTDAEKLQATISFRGPAAVTVLSGAPSGTFQIGYSVKFIGKKEGEVVETIVRDFSVTANISKTTTYQFTPGGTYVSPTLINQGEGNYALTPGSVTPGGSLTGTEVKLFRFNPMTATYEITYSEKEPAIEKSGDVASAVASRQKAWDDAIVVGDLYKVGSALAICTDRSPADKLFESEADFVPEGQGSGQAITATFTTVRPGTANLTSLDVLRTNGTDDPVPRATATSNSHVYRVALANVTTTRPCRVVEIGIRSTMGIRIGGLCNFKDALTYEEINGRACKNYEGNKVEKGKILRVDIFQSGSLSTSEDRFSFFRISYREAGTNTAFTALSTCFGIRCITQQAAYNSIRLNMNSVKRWEFRFEPLSGWEIRNGIAGGALELIDSKLATDRFIADSGVNLGFRGISLARAKDTFALNSVRRPADSEIGINFTDEDSYLDAWGRLAEDFLYEEVQSSVNGNPEHEIVYINEICENATPPLYDNLAIVGLNIRSAVEFQQFSQFSAYVTKGIECRRLLSGLAVGPTHLFPDILLDLLTNDRYGKGDLIPDELIDMDSFRAAAQWCNTRGYFFDGAITNRQNLRQWAADVAATHLLIFGEANGRFFLRPVFGQVQIKSLFSAGNIKENSFKFQYLDSEDRRPIQVSVRWREERPNSDPTNPGLFPVEREILVRERTTPDTAPIESVDMSDYCTSRKHAIDAAKYIIRARRLNNSAIRFETTYEGVMASLAPADYIKVAMDESVYDEFANGVVTPEGALVCTKPLADGSYSTLMWNGDNNRTPYDGPLVVSNGGRTATPTGVVFTVKRAGSEVRTYQVESIEATNEGYLAIEAIHVPMSGSTLELEAGFDTAGNWIIQE